MKLNNHTVIKRDRRLLFEIIVIILLTFLPSFLFKTFKGLAIIIPLLYIFIEKKRRNCTWGELGFYPKNTILDIKKNWFLTILVSFIIQLAVFFIGKYFVPEFIEHIKLRIPLIEISTIVPLFITVTIGTFGEEFIFRGFIQERLGWFIKPSYAIIVTSLIFGFMHFYRGAFLIAAFDIGAIIIDSIIYGIIFNRTKNIFASWIAHYLADIVAIILILFFI